MTTAPDWFAEKFQLSTLTVSTSAFWTWSVRPVQCTLGASVLSLNRPCEAWGQVTAGENAELASVVAGIERRLSAAYSYDKINYLMLMMVDPQVHFHVIPRYESSRERYGLTWKDGAWPKPPDLASSVNDAAVLEQIRRDLLQKS